MFKLMIRFFETKLWKECAAKLFFIFRTTSVGTCSTIARFGAIGGLLIEILGDYWKPAPNVFMGIITILAGSLAIFLPETAGLSLPETMEQAVALSKRPARGLFSCIFPKSFRELIFGKKVEIEDCENVNKSKPETND